MGGGVEGEGPRWKIGRLVGRRGGWGGGEPGERKKGAVGRKPASDRDAKCKVQTNLCDPGDEKHPM